MVALTLKTTGQDKVRKMHRRARAAATERKVAKTVVDSMLKTMQRLAPKGRSSARSPDLTRTLMRFSRREGKRWIEGIRIDGRDARGKAKAVAFGTRRHRAIEKFIQEGRRARKVFNRFRREFRRQIKKGGS